MDEIKPVKSKKGAKAAAEKRPKALPYARERGRFRTLLAANPNYFGNLKVSPFEPVLNIQGNTTYEEFGCVGFQPQFDRLEAVVYVNQPSGYGGDICSSGTPEYVRFYMSTDNGASWDDLGLTSFTAYNIPEGTLRSRRLEYAVTLDIDTRKKFCFVENLAQVRAILSWNVPPPPNDPGFIPVWGDVHNTNIQIEPRRSFVISDLLAATSIEPVPQLAQVMDLNKTLSATAPSELSVSELSTLYQDKGVEPHRFALTEIQKFIDQPGASEGFLAAAGKGLLANLDIDLSQIGDLLNPVDGSTRYEELECIGLDPHRDFLTGVIRVKLPSGYSGDQCTAGSREYVTFWADFNDNGTFETCLGTTSVNVHDFDSVALQT